MDDVLCNFKKGVKDKILTPTLSEETFPHFPQSMVGFFILLEPIEGAINAIKTLEKNYDVWILTRPSFLNIHCYTEKAVWIKKYLGYEMQKKLILCGDKSLVKGDYLIDDSIKDGQDRFEGKLIRFGSNDFPTWKEVMEYFSKEIK